LIYLSDGAATCKEAAGEELGLMCGISLQPIFLGIFLNEVRPIAYKRDGVKDLLE
jgi:hypothetical protein